MEKSKRNSLIKRILSTLILAPIVVGAILAGWNTTAILLLVVSALLAWEWAAMVPNKNNAVYAVAYLVAAAAMFSFSDILFSLLVMIGSAVFVWLKAKGEKDRWLLVLGVPYITLGIGSFAWFYTLFGAVISLWYVLAIWSVDIGGYIVGCNVKGPKLAPKISPNKTWSGLLGAMLLSCLTCLIFAYFYFPHTSAVYIFCVCFGSALAIVAQCGDLLESKVKRFLNVKDSSDLIPGHGGMFDRLDGMLFATPFVLIVLYVLYVM